MEEKTITLSEVIRDNSQAVFRLMYRGTKYTCMYDSKQGHFYSYVNGTGRYPKVIIMQPSHVSNCEVLRRSKYMGYKVIIDSTEK